ncbi:2'-5' RNA ligase family protein [Arthrobacter sp. H20]|uniref:2'-5' RNA ligase family protein n=1 Tax=Arthrobacter sp. H20 TaxID=1267981 RepID=UPI0004B39AF0|nr:2'-5' RNA ligase family protein [Arthrobacter sp. H20]
MELLLDESSEQFIRAQWDALQAAGLPSRAAHRSPHHRPHITVLAAPVITGDQDQRIRDVLTGPLAVSFEGFVLFDAGRKGYVLARQVVCTADLLQLHRAVHSTSDVEGSVPTSLPDAWVPHITLANAVAGERLAEALTIVGAPMPEGSVRAARRWDSRAKTITELV